MDYRIRPKPRLSQMHLKGGQYILIGYIPPPFCSVLLDVRGGPDPCKHRLGMVGEVACALHTEELVFTPYVSHTKVCIENKEIDYKGKVAIPCGGQLTFGRKPYETILIVTSGENGMQVQQVHAQRSERKQNLRSWLAQHNATGIKVIRFGYLPYPGCDVVLNRLATNYGAKVYDTDAVIGILYISHQTGKGVFTPKATHTKILINGKEIDYSKTIEVSPEAGFTLGAWPYQRQWAMKEARPALLSNPNHRCMMENTFCKLFSTVHHHERHIMMWQQHAVPYVFDPTHPYLG